MKKTYFRLICLVMPFVILGLSKKENVRVKSNKFKADIEELSPYSYIENSSKKKKYFVKIPKNYNILNEYKHKKKSNNLEKEAKQQSYLSRIMSFIDLKNSSIYKKQMNPIHMKKNKRNLSKMYNLKKKNEDLNNTKILFTQMVDSLLNNNDISKSYSELIKKIDTNSNLMKDIHDNVSIYLAYKIDSGPPKHKNSKHDFIVSQLGELQTYTKKTLDYYKSARKEVEGKMKYIQSLNNKTQGNKKIVQLKDFKRLITDYNSKIDATIWECTEKNKKLYMNLKYKINGVTFESFPSDCVNYIEGTEDKINGYDIEHSTFMESNNNFTTFSLYVLSYKNKQPNQKETAKALRQIITDIHYNEIWFTGNGEYIKNIRNYLITSMSNIGTFNFENTEKMNKSFHFILATCELRLAYNMSLKYREIFELKKKEFYDILRNSERDLENMLIALAHPKNLLLESAQINSNSQTILSNVNDIIKEISKIIQYLSNNYHSSSFSSKKNELINEFSKINAHNDNMKHLGVNINKQYLVINTKKYLIQMAKDGISFISMDRTDSEILDFLENRDSFESDIKLINSSFHQLNHDYNKLRELSDQVKKLKVIVLQKNNELKTLKEKEDKSKKNIISSIKNKLEQIKLKISDLNKIKNLNGTDNEDLKTIEALINGSSCDLKEHTKRMNEIKKRINTANNNLNNAIKSDTMNIISKFIIEKSKLHYEKYGLNDLNKIFDEAKQMYNKMDSIIINARKSQNDTIHAINDSKKLKNDVKIKLIEDLYNKMKISFENFKSIKNKVSLKISDYKKKELTLKNYESNIIKMKNEYLNKYIEEDNTNIPRSNILNEATNFSKNHANYKGEISGQINNEKGIINTIKDQFNLYSVVEKFFVEFKGIKVINDLIILKQNINKEKINDQLMGHQRNFKSITDMIDNSVNTIKHSNEKIEIFKVLNYILNVSNKNNKSINDFKGDMSNLKEKVNAENNKINKDTLINKEEKVNILNKLKEKINEIDDIIKEANDLNQESTNLLKSTESSKKTVDNIQSIKDGSTHSEDASKKKIKITNITDKINKLKSKSIKLQKDIEYLIQNHNSSIAKLFYDRVLKLEHEINNNIDEILNNLKSTKQNFENFNSEKDMEKIKNENIKRKQSEIAQGIKNILNSFSSYEGRLGDIKKRCKIQTDKIKGENKNVDNLNVPETNIRNIYVEMTKISEELNSLKKGCKQSIQDINIKKLEYDKAFIDDYFLRINYEKKKAENEMKLIEDLKTKVEQLKEKLKLKEAELKNFNCEEYVNSAKQNKNKILELEIEAGKLKKEAHDNENLNEIDRIKKDVEKHMIDSINFRNIISDNLDEIKNMEKTLVSENFKNIMSEIINNVQRAKEESEKAKNELKKSETTKSIILDSFQNAKTLKDSLKINLEEHDIDNNIEEIKKIKNAVSDNVKIMNKSSIEAEKYKGASSIHYHNVIRDKDKIIYLKSHNQDTKKEITDETIERIENYVNESENYTNEADKNAKGADKNYKLASEYETKVNDILNESLILAEKIKSQKKKNEINKKFNLIKNVYDNIEKLLEVSKKKLIELKKQANIIKNEDEGKSEKSISAFIEIESIKNNANVSLSEIEIIEKSTKNIFSNVQNAINSISTEPKSSEGNISDKLKIEQDYLKSISDTLEMIKNSEILLLNEEKKLKQIEDNADNMEIKLKKMKKTYEEGVLEEIKKEADNDKDIELIKNSINSMIDISIEFFSKYSEKKNDIKPKLEDAKKKVNELYDTFNESYKKIENLSISVLGPVTHEEAKEKKEEGNIEKEKLKKQIEQMKKLLNDVNNIKNNEGLKLMSIMKENIDITNKKAMEDHSKVDKYLDEIKINLENIKNSGSVIEASDYLDEIKSENNEINIIKTKYSYKNEADIIYNDIIQIANFLDIKEGSGNETINNAKKIVEKIEETLNDINNKEDEGKNIINEADNIIEQIKLIMELKEKIKESKNKINDVSGKINSLHEKCIKIRETNIYVEEYDNIFKDNAKYNDLKELISSYKKKSSEIENELNIDIDTINFEFKNSINDLENIVENSRNDTTSIIILQKIKIDIDEIMDKLNSIYNKAIKNNATIDELSELIRNSKFELLDLIVTHIDIEISNDKLSIERIKVYINDCFQYIKNNHELMTSDVSNSNKFHSKNPLSKYESVHLKDANMFAQDFKRKEKDAIETIINMQNIFPLISETKSEIDADNAFRTLKEHHRKSKEEKSDINNIYKYIHDAKLNEMEENAKKYFDIAKSFEQFPDIQEKKLLDSKNKLKVIEDYIIEMENESKRIESPYTEESLKKYNDIYEKAKMELDKMRKLEDDSLSENKDMEQYVDHISYLIERTKTLLNDTESYQYENNYELSDEENKKIANESNKSVKRTNEKTNESKRIFEHIRYMIQKNKEILLQENQIFQNIYEIMKKLENTGKNIKRELDAKKIENNIKSYLNEIIRMTNDSLNNYIHNEKIKTITKKVEVKKEVMKKFNNSNEIKDEIVDIQNDNDYLKERKSKMKHILEKMKNEKEKMDKEFNNISESDNFMAYSNSQEYIYQGERYIKKLIDEIDKIEKLIKENENIIKQFEDGNNKESNGGNDKYEKGKFDASNAKLAGGIFGGLLLFSGISFIASKKNEESDPKIVDEEFQEYENDNDDFDLDEKDIAIEVNLFDDY
ncbi:reticulocyte binding protein, putative [Plasmodium gallinaceum]|uniref:Reticulocyte binding protein, putative n=1 Tax=Plasmodium gallinaceum TaxID=5849 RepID=A0A1J1GU91_PLAGA|nr:reticulocyte binding protein, putative [Plasmodium gallinaceum]CRG96079.1 reticulocyte binding protein, putative [Plasmodium gallinaceum]